MSGKIYNFLIAMLIATAAFAQDPCAGTERRALVLGGGGSKGAFEAGAAYHLIVHRGCNFVELSGNSVGALNSSVLAQAKSSNDAQDSHANMQAQAESLVSLWQSIHGTRDVLKNRRFGSLRFALFGGESLKDFKPLAKLIRKNVDLERLESGRELRIGTVSFTDGVYHEVVLNDGGEANKNTYDFLLASGMIPMFGVMPRIGDAPSQFCDGGLRHNSPLASYFMQCASDAQCKERAWLPPHGQLEQLFVVVTTPYRAGDHGLEIVDPAAFKTGTRDIRDGRKVMSRAIDVMMDTVHRADLDSLLSANELLAWQAKSPQGEFPLRSFNATPDGMGSRPYTIAVVAPALPDRGMDDVLNFSPKRIASQLYCGCMAADEVMTKQFGLDSVAGKCMERFVVPGVDTNSCGLRGLQQAGVLASK